MKILDGDAPKKAARVVARHTPILRDVLDHRAALVADRDQLLREREQLSTHTDEVVTSLHKQLSILKGQLQDAEQHRDRLAEAVVSLKSERDLVTSQRESLATMAHQLLLLRNDPRSYLAHRFLKGDGIEIGALHRPVQLPEAATARYVDRMRADDLRAEYPEWNDAALVDPSIIDDGEKLENVAHASVDFIIANHFLEHCEDPLGTLLVHLARLREGGHLYYAIPDKRHTFDRNRPCTTLEHILADHQDGGANSRDAHFLEYSELVWLSQTPPVHAQVLKDTNYSIHYHVWTCAEILELMIHIQREHEPNLQIVALQSFDDEFIVVAQKGSATDEPSPNELDRPSLAAQPHDVQPREVQLDVQPLTVQER
jgi:SAM-dependent methyltransferase